MAAAPVDESEVPPMIGRGRGDQARSVGGQEATLGGMILRCI
jgi:hypothetical protein